MSFNRWEPAMRRVIAVLASGFVWLVTAAVMLPTAAAQGSKAPTLRIRCERQDALYKVGEKATFLIQSSEDGDAVYRLSDDGFRILEHGKIRLTKGKTYSLRGTLEAPGFLQLRVDQTVSDLQPPHIALAAAG